jgi:hypothetical protein
VSEACGALPRSLPSRARTSHSAILPKILEGGGIVVWVGLRHMHGRLAITLTFIARRPSGLLWPAAKGGELAAWRGPPRTPPNQRSTAESGVK